MYIKYDFMSSIFYIKSGNDSISGLMDFGGTLKFRLIQPINTAVYPSIQPSESAP